MNVTTLRFLKEARPLFWPWCFIILVSALPRVLPLPLHHWTTPIAVWGFSFGIPLLASLPFGDEFQHRTISLLLSQPVSRMEIWWEKLSVTAVAVLSVELVLSRRAMGPDVYVIAASWPIATIASAAFWTLMARSTLGGFVLNIAAYGLTGCLVTFVTWHFGYAAHASTMDLALTYGVVGLCYGAVMLWLGRRQLARFQVTGGMACDDLLMAGPDVMPRSLTQWLRPRPTGAVRNLILREFRLLRPVWLIILLAALGWAGLMLLELLHERGFSRYFETAVISMGVVSTLLIAILAGSVSLGEEKTSGTHAWHLTLPVPAFRQWAIKLSIAVFAGCVGTGSLPMVALGVFRSSSSHTLGESHFGTGWLLLVALLTSAAFWCACAVDGTVAAVLWAVPVTVVLGSAGFFANPWADYLAIAFWGPPNAIHNLQSNWLISSVADRGPIMLNLLGNLRFDWWVARVTGPHLRHLGWLFPLENSGFYATVVGVPALILGLVQSYRLFRSQPRDSARSVIRNLLPLALLLFLCGFSLTLISDFWVRAAMQVPYFTGAVSSVIQKKLPSAAKLHPTQPLQLSGDDVDKERPWPFADSTRRWLSGARITVTPDKAHPGGFSCTPGPWANTWCYYSATIHLADGTDIFQSYDPPSDGRFHFGPTSLRVRWPGATTQQTLWGR